jgi:hypothetical protein
VIGGGLLRRRPHVALCRLPARPPRSRVAAVKPQSPAAGEVRVGDVVTHIDGERVRHARNAWRALQLVGATVDLVLVRPTTARIGRFAAVTEPTDDLGPAYLTAKVEGAENMRWHEEVAMTVSPQREILRIRLFDQKAKGPPKGPKQKPLLVGTADIRIDEVALACMVTGPPCVRAYPVRSSDDDAAPVVGKVELTITHHHRHIDELSTADVEREASGACALPDGFVFDVAAKHARSLDTEGGGSPRPSSPTFGGPGADQHDVDAQIQQLQGWGPRPARVPPARAHGDPSACPSRQRPSAARAHWWARRWCLGGQVH